MRMSKSRLIVCLAIMATCLIPGLQTRAETLPDSSPPILKPDDISYRNVGLDWDVVRRDSREGCVTRLMRSYPRTRGETSISLDAARETALRFISSHDVSFTLPESCSLVIERVITNHYDPSLFPERSHDYVINYRPTYSGYPLLGSRCQISMTHAGDIFHVRHFAPSGALLPTSHGIDALDILAYAAAHLGDTEVDLVHPPRLFAMMPDRVVWVVNVSEPHHMELVIDANTGEVVSERTNVIEQAPAGEFWLHGQIDGSMDGTGNLQGMPRVSVSIIDEDPIFPDTLWEGESDDSGLYNTTSPEYFSLWEDPFHINEVEAFVRADLDCDAVRVERFVAGGNPQLIQISTVPFTPSDQGDHTVNIQFNTAVQMEGSCGFREILRGGATSWGQTPKTDKVVVEVLNNLGSRTNGTRIYLSPGHAILPGDVILHEYGHTIMWEYYGDMWISGHTDDDGGHPGECPNDCANCGNHQAANNDCSADAVMEGWASYYTVAAHNTNPGPFSPADHTYDVPGSTFSWDLESNTSSFIDSGGVLHGNNNDYRDEAVIASILWDLYDGTNAGDNDGLHLGGSQVWNLVINQTPYTTKELYETAYILYPEQRHELWEIFHTHSLDDTDAIVQAPSQIIPATGASYSHLDPIVLGWTNVPDTHFGDTTQNHASGSYYTVQISTAADFSADLEEYERAVNSHSVQLQPGDYYLRVRAEDYAGNTPGPWSAVSEFTVEEFIGIATMDFENGIDNTVISSTIPGMFFTTTQGYDWLYGDATTGNYNVDPYGQYVCNGDFFAWLGPNQGTGRIDFTGATARSISLLTSTYTGLYLEAFDAQGNMIDQDYTPGNLGSYQLAPLHVSGDDIAYMLIHDGGNYWLIDDLQVEDLLRTTEQMMGSGYAVGAEALDLINQGLTAFYSFMNNGSSSFQVILNWAGSEFGITAYMPDGEIYGQWQSAQPPLITIIDQPMNGEWMFEVTAIDVPNDDYPYAFVLGVSEPDPDTTPPLVSVLSPAPGETVGLHEEVMFTFEAQDPESGIMELAGLVDLTTELVSGQSMSFDTPGEHEIQVTAVNYIGLSSTETVSFNVADQPAGCLWSDATTGPLGDTIDGHGVSWGDFDGDGDEDLFLANNGANRLLRNDGDGNYVKLDVLLGGTGDSRVGCWGDYDNDDDLDLYVVNGGGPNYLYRNDDGVFVDVTDGPLGDAQTNTSGSWCDWDLDGDIDLYLTADDGWSKLLRNDDGVFTEIIGDPASFEGWSRGHAWGDYDNDDDPDLYVTTKEGPNRLFRNDLGMGFVDVTAPPVNDAGSGKGCAWGDYDNDGWLDLYVVNKDGANRLFRNDEGVFVDVTDPVTGDEGDGRTCVWGDYDNNGWLDLFLTNVDGDNKLLHNLHGTGFADSTCGDLAAAELTAWGAAFADDDRDGDLDLYVSNHTWQGVPNRMFRNGLYGGGWLALKLVGTTSNRDGLGARIELTADGETQMRQIAPSGYLVQAPTVCHFGIGDATQVTVKVSWPSGIVQEFPVHELNTCLEVVEFASTGVDTPPTDLAFRIGNRPNPFNPSTTIFFTLPEAAEVRLQIFDVSGRLVRTLVNGDSRGIGEHREVWNGRTSDGSTASSGLYFYRIVAGKYRATQSMTLVK